LAELGAVEAHLELGGAADGRDMYGVIARGAFDNQGHLSRITRIKNHFGPLRRGVVQERRTRTTSAIKYS
jgi:hypothetical protein